MTIPLMRLIAENIGPFERLDIDFSDGNGKPHCGPHILTGVNGIRQVDDAPCDRVGVILGRRGLSRKGMAAFSPWDKSWDEVGHLARSLGLEDSVTVPAENAFRWTRFGKGPRYHPFTASAYAHGRRSVHTRPCERNSGQNAPNWNQRT